MKKFIVFLLLGVMFVFNTVAYAQAENTSQDKIGGADKATDIQVNNNVNTVKRWILINIPARSLRLYDNDKCIEMYPVGVGKIETKTPVGFYKVVEKIVNPTWTDPADVSVVIPSGEDNPLGYRWIGIGGNYGIHGTNRPDSVGHYVSNGCVRMVEADVEKVFDKVEVGTEVQIMYNRLVIDKTFDGRVAYYIYPDGYDMQNLTVDFVKQGLKGYGIADFITDEAVAKSIELSNGQPNYVAAPVNIMFNGKKLNYKAVNYKNLIYVPVKALATTLNTPITMDNNLVKTQKGEADISLYSNVAYMRLTDIANIFDYEQMKRDILFIREFADKEHHQREEKILFRYMIEYLGKVAENLVRHGMIVEHDLARLYVKQWDEALQRYHRNHLLIDKLTIISNGHAYCMLLRRHIEKEDTVVYPFAKKHLSEEIFAEMIKENQNY